MRKRRYLGLSKSPVYRVWHAMMDRCYLTTCATYKNYGARGITVVDSWHVFENFFADMGNPPAKGMQLNRIDNDGPYSRENCNWVSRKDNCRNKRNNAWFTVAGKRIPAWKVYQKLSKGSVYWHMKRWGISFEEYLARKGIDPSVILND